MNNTALKLIPTQKGQSQPEQLGARALVQSWVDAAQEKLDVRNSSTHAYLVLNGLSMISLSRRILNLMATFDTEREIPTLHLIRLLGIKGNMFQEHFTALVWAGAVFPMPLSPEGMDDLITELATKEFAKLEEASDPVEMVLYLWRLSRGSALNPAIGTVLREEISAAAWGA